MTKFKQKYKKRICLECAKSIDSKSRKFTKHIKDEHNITYEKYIIKNFYNNTQPLCRCGCKTKLKFKQLTDGPWFFEYTTNHRKKGTTHSATTKLLIKERTIESIRKKYGVDNYFQTNECIKKIKETKAKRYGNENYNNQEKNKKTSLKKYGFETNFKNPNYRKKYNTKTSKIETLTANTLNAQHKF